MLYMLPSDGSVFELANTPLMYSSKFEPVFWSTICFVSPILIDPVYTVTWDPFDCLHVNIPDPVYKASLGYSYKISNGYCEAL